MKEEGDTYKIQLGAQILEVRPVMNNKDDYQHASEYTIDYQEIIGLNDEEQYESERRLLIEKIKQIAEYGEQ